MIKKPSLLYYVVSKGNHMEWEGQGVWMKQQARWVEKEAEASSLASWKDSHGSLGEAFGFCSPETSQKKAWT